MMSIFVLHEILFFFFFNDTATTEIYTLSLHDALPISLRFHQTLRKELVNGDAVDPLQALLISRAAFGSDGFKTGSHARKFRNHVSEIVAGDAHELDMVERRARCRPIAAPEQTDFAEIIAPGQVREHHFSAGIVLQNLHEPDPHKIETVCRRSEEHTS